MECLTQEYLEYFDAQDLAPESVVGTESSNAVEDLEAGCASTLVDDDSQSFACLSGQNDLNAVPVEGKQCSFESKHHDLQSQCSIPTTLDDGKIVECDAIVSGGRPVSSTDQKFFLLIDNNEDRPAKKQKVYQSDRVAVISGLTFRLKAKTTTVICEDTGVCMRQAGYGSMDLYCETCQWKCEQPCLCACHSLAYHYNMRS